MKNPILKLAALALPLFLACSGGGDKGLAVTGVELDKYALELPPGGTGTLVCTVQPPDAGNKAVTWTSSAPGVAAVSGGAVTVAADAAAGGEATITVRTEDGGREAACKVTVVVPATGVAMDPAAMTIPVGTSWSLAAILEPSGATPRSVEWASDMPAVAKVEGDGLNATVTAGGANETATIAVTVDGDKRAVCKVTVMTPATGVALDRAELVMVVGSSGRALVATVQPETASDRRVTWNSSNSGVATVSDGGVVTLAASAAAGDAATITVTTVDGGHKATCGLTVEARQPAVQKAGATIAGSAHSVAIKDDGSLWACGYNGYYDVGDGTYYPRHTLVRIGDGNDWAAVSASNCHTMAIRADGSLWGWGLNPWGQLGFISEQLMQNGPRRVGMDNDWTTVAAGYEHGAGIKADGTLWVWGRNDYGQLGLGDTDNREAPVQLGTDDDWRLVAAGWGYTMAIKADGSLWGWGMWSGGKIGCELSAGDQVNPDPVRVGADNDWAYVACGYNHTVALRADGSLWSWGDNYRNRLGRDILPNPYTHMPGQVGTAKDWKALAVTYEYSVALRDDGTAWAWGANEYGQLGVDDTADRPSPVQMGADSDWAAVGLGHGHTLLLKADGSLWACGLNQDGQLGVDDTTNRLSPVKMAEGFMVE